MADSQPNTSRSIAFAAVTTLFFAWGFITSLVDPLVAAVKGIFTLSDVEAQLSASAFFMAYGLVSFPAAILLARLKSVPSILVALGTMIGGCVLMLIAANVALYPLVLLGLFILASGITILQVAANPLAAALGDPKGSHFRLTLSQTFNSVGTFLGPMIGSGLFLRGLEIKDGSILTDAVRNDALNGIDTAYFWLSALILALMLFFFLSRKVVTTAAPPQNANAAREVATLLRSTLASPLGIIGIAGIIVFAGTALLGITLPVDQTFGGTVAIVLLFIVLGLKLNSRWALLGGIAIFVYVGAEVAIGTQMALFLNSDAIMGGSDALLAVPGVSLVVPQDGLLGLSLEQAGKAVSLYWGGAMIGRAIGAALLARFDAARLLAAFAVVATVLCLYIVVVGGVNAGFVALAIGLFNSIMFPVIFTLTLERSTASEEATSGYLCTAIVGGAIVPLIVGRLSATSGYAGAFIAPALCYALLVVFAFAASRAAVRRASVTGSTH